MDPEPDHPRMRIRPITRRPCRRTHQEEGPGWYLGSSFALGSETLAPDSVNRTLILRISGLVHGFFGVSSAAVSGSTGGEGGMDGIIFGLLMAFSDVGADVGAVDIEDEF